MFSVVQNRFWANGMSRLMVYAATLSFNSAMAVSKVWVCLLHTPVSSDGTTLNRRALAGVLARVTTSRISAQAKSGALSPTLISGPTRLKGFSLKFNLSSHDVLLEKVRYVRTDQIMNPGHPWSGCDRNPVASTDRIGIPSDDSGDLPLAVH